MDRRRSLTLVGATALGVAGRSKPRCTIVRASDLKDRSVEKQGANSEPMASTVDDVA